ncbi:MAG: hypothetical protein KC502_05225 [Myxococcales bacterium]|nr:hypothetical protein [Myxococcales bacterium]
MPLRDSQLRTIHMHLCVPVVMAMLLAACGPAEERPGPAGDVISEDATGDSASDGAPQDSERSTARLQHVELGTFDSSAAGLTDPIAFDLPVGVTAMVIRVEGDPAGHYIIAALERDAGFSLIPKAWLAQTPLPDACVGPCANRIAAQPGAAAFLFPNTPLVDLRPGKHSLKIFAFDAARKPMKTSVSVSLDWVRPKDPPNGWRLPINICFTSAMGWTKATGPQQPRLTAALATAKKLFGQAGITLAPIRWFDVSKSGQYIATRTGPTSDLMKLFKSGAGLPIGVNVFLTERIIKKGALPGANVALGLAGGVPGVPNSVGHARDGVVLSLHIPTGQEDVLGYTLAHELGHYLGLFHSSEAKGASGGGAHDTLPDTAEHDQHNLMYWSVTSSATQLSHEQRQVLRRSPWLIAN